MKGKGGGNAGNVSYYREKEEALGYLVKEMKRGDILLTLGAGDVWRLGEKALKRFNET
jgi:UDP-N-acetylmuramate--alanine ligase